MIYSMITTGSLNMQDMIRILNQSGHDFSGKHLCDEYCMDIMWCLFVKVKNQQSSYDFVTLFLRICYIFLFECKDP